MSDELKDPLIPEQDIVEVPRVYYRKNNDGIDFSTKPLEGYKLHPIFMTDAVDKKLKELGNQQHT